MRDSKKAAFEHSEDPSTRLSTWGLRNALGYGEKSWHQSSPDPGGQPARLGSGRLGGASKAARGPSPAGGGSRCSAEADTSSSLQVKSESPVEEARHIPVR